jgi:hypothetical protein
MSIKQVDAQESSKASECIKVELKERLTLKEKLLEEVIGWWEPNIFREKEASSCVAPTTTGQGRFPIVAVGAVPGRHVHGTFVGGYSSGTGG